VFDLVLNCYFCICSYWFCFCDDSKIEGSQATAKLTAELLRSVISHQRVPHTNQATYLINAVRAVGEQIIDANPIGIYIKFSYFLFYFITEIYILWYLLECMGICLAYVGWGFGREVHVYGKHLLGEINLNGFVPLGISFWFLAGTMGTQKI